MAEQVAEAASSDHKTILIGIDGSEQAEAAFDFYMDHLHKDGNRLLLIHSAEPPYVSSQQAMYMSGQLWEQMLSTEKEHVRELEAKFAEKMKAKGVSGKIKAMFSGKPGEAIVETANAEKVTMIVMGTRGLGTVRRTILGSVSDHVIHHAHCPVVVVRCSA